MFGFSKVIKVIKYHPFNVFILTQGRNLKEKICIQSAKLFAVLVVAALSSIKYYYLDNCILLDPQCIKT